MGRNAGRGRKQCRFVQLVCRRISSLMFQALVPISDRGREQDSMGNSITKCEKNPQQALSSHIASVFLLISSQATSWNMCYGTASFAPRIQSYQRLYARGGPQRVPWCASTFGCV